jgi:hypothetical protein
MKLNESQKRLPLNPSVRDEIICELAEVQAGLIMDDGFESIYDLLVNGCRGFEDYSDAELLEAIDGHTDED